MDKAVLFHKDDELFLIKAQKRILAAVNSSNIVAFPFFPIFCPLKNASSDFFTKEDFKSAVKSVSFLSPVVDCEGIIVPVTFTKKDSTLIQQNVRISIFFTRQQNILELERIISSLDLPFPHEVRRFRIADFLKDGYKTEFFNEKWISLKN